MAERPHPHQLQVHPQHRYGDTGVKSLLPQRGGPSASKVIALVTLLPVGGTLLGLAAVTLFFTFVGLAVITPIFIVCSPVLVPAAIAAGLALTGLLTSGTFGLTGLSSLSWALNFFRQASAQVPQQLDEAKRRMQDVAVQMGQKTKEVGQAIQNKAQETK